MSSIKPIAADWLSRYWMLLLAFTVAILVVFVLRRLCRRVFGAERSFQLWLIPPLAMLVSQLPHATAVRAFALPPVVFTITSAADALSSPISHSAGIDWRVYVALLWLTGLMVTLASAALAQLRYRARLSGAMQSTDVSSRWPMLRAATTDVGPALVGVWRPCIVLPADFESRYNTTEQALIVAHESMHARRHDGWWCVLVQVAVALFWFHPLAWLAFSAIRHDQELACDAAVLREHGTQRRSYVNAMLKTSSASVLLPIGCRWSPRHPLTERIAMLKHARPGKARSFAAHVVIAALAIGVSSMVYAGMVEHHEEYQLNMKMDLRSDDGHQAHAQRATVALCTAPGKIATISISGWKVNAVITPENDGQLRMNFAINGAKNELLAQSQVQGAAGDVLHAEGKAQNNKYGYAFEVTPLTGCPARDTANTKDASHG